jgi:putative colanic acid biosynthesis acetyltransferase WcaF
MTRTARTVPGRRFPETLPSGKTTKFKMQDIGLAEKLYNRIGILLFNMFVTYIPSHLIRQNFMRLFGAHIGKGTAILRGAQVFDLRYLSIGDNCSIGFRVLFDARGGITIGDNVVIASDTQFICGGHDINHPDFPSYTKPTLVEDYVWIASRSMVLPCTIGRGAVVAAQALVTKDVAPLDVVGGNPAKPFSRRDPEALKYTPKYRPLFY